MTPLRIGFDMDGVLADFKTAYQSVEARLFGSASSTEPESPEQREIADESDAADDVEADPRVTFSSLVQERKRRDLIWREIRRTSDFWATLPPIDPGAVRRIHTAMLRHGWEVFFITQRPWTAGEPVQRQTQHWLVAQGYDLPSVLVLDGSRGRAAGALRLQFHVDDSPKNCVDVLADSTAKPLLLVPDGNPEALASARQLRIGVAGSIAQALDILEEASTVRTQPRLTERLAALVGWR